jgi:hypothetical protein
MARKAGGIATRVREVIHETQRARIADPNENDRQRFGRARRRERGGVPYGDQDLDAGPDEVAGDTWQPLALLFGPSVKDRDATVGPFQRAKAIAEGVEKVLVRFPCPYPDKSDTGVSGGGEGRTPPGCRPYSSGEQNNRASPHLLAPHFETFRLAQRLPAAAIKVRDGLIFASSA